MKVRFVLAVAAAIALVPLYAVPASAAQVPVTVSWNGVLNGPLSISPNPVTINPGDSVSVTFNGSGPFDFLQIGTGGLCSNVTTILVGESGTLTPSSLTSYCLVAGGQFGQSEAMAFTVNVPTPVTPTTVGGCSGGEALASLKDTTGAGITSALPVAPNVDKVSIKSLTTGAMSCSGVAAADGAVDPGSFKATLTGAVSCNTAATPPHPVSGKIGWTAATGNIKEQGYVRFAADHPGINFYSDVVTVHGIMTKGPLGGYDIDGTLFQDPTVKDKTTGAAFGGFTGVDMNPADSLLIGASCQTGTSAGPLSFNNGLGGAKGPVAAPTAITLTMVGDGQSLLENTGQLGGVNGNLCPCIPASGLVFSVS